MTSELDPRGDSANARVDCDVLVVGAGPTGLTLAAALHSGGASVRVVDQNLDRVFESRALAVQARTLEVLRAFGLADEMVRRGNPAVRFRIHAGRRQAPVRLFDVGFGDTAFDFLLFLSQAATEELLDEHLRGAGVPVERGVRFETFREQDGTVLAELRDPSGGSRVLRARYLVGCDGAHSAVRGQAGIEFVGASYPETFLLADLAADGLEPDTVHAFLAQEGPLLFFPLGRPAPWRLIAMRTPAQEQQASPAPPAPPASAAPAASAGPAALAASAGPAASAAPPASAAPQDTAPVSLDELQHLTDVRTGGGVTLHDPVWATAFRLHHRGAARYRAGRVFLAGDAAHIHSPAGGQGMNTGIQDAVNLGWKLALACRRADSGGPGPSEALLDSYDAERRPVGDYVLRFTDRAFSVVTSRNPLVRALRTVLVPRVLPLAMRVPGVRAAAFRTVSQLGVRYRNSAAVQPAPADTRARRPGAGERLPDARILSGGRPVWLQEALHEPVFHVLLVGAGQAWDRQELVALRERYAGLVRVHLLDRNSKREAEEGRGEEGRAELLSDADGLAFRRLNVSGQANLLIRPDGYLAYRADDADLTGLLHFLGVLLDGIPDADAGDEGISR